jgi:hypothetical protein
MDQHRLTRRRFVVSFIALSSVAGSALRPDLFAISKAWAESFSPPDDAVRQAMVRMARLLFPHDALSDDVYAEVLDQALTDTAGNSELAAHLDAATTALNQQPGDAWHELDEAAQIAAMHVRAGIYNGAAFWKHVGYPGPSKQFGGYLHRGAGDIDWLPEEE